MTTIKETIRFQKDLKKIAKKQSLIADKYEHYVKISLSKLDEVGNVRNAIRINGLGAKYEDYPIYKIKKHQCAEIRMIYHYDANNNTVTMLEAYCKNQQENEDRKLVLSYLDDLIENRTN